MSKQDAERELRIAKVVSLVSAGVTPAEVAVYAREKAKWPVTAAELPPLGAARRVLCPPIAGRASPRSTWPTLSRALPAPLGWGATGWPPGPGYFAASRLGTRIPTHPAPRAASAGPPPVGPWFRRVAC